MNASTSSIPPPLRRKGAHKDARYQNSRPEGEAKFKSYFALTGKDPWGCMKQEANSHA